VFGHIHAGKSDALGVLRGGKEIVRWDESERALEGVLRRHSHESIWGYISSWRNAMDCYYLLTFILSGVAALIQDRIMGRGVPETLMVNAALTYCNTGKLGNKPQAVVI
jgi:hypothetical protein